MLKDILHRSAAGHAYARIYVEYINTHTHTNRRAKEIHLAHSIDKI